MYIIHVPLNTCGRDSLMALICALTCARIPTVANGMITARPYQASGLIFSRIMITRNESKRKAHEDKSLGSGILVTSAPSLT